MPKKPGSTGLKIVTRQGSPHLYLRGTVRGIRVFESLGTADWALAEEARSTKEAELFRGAVHGFAPATVSFAAAALAYLQDQPRAASTTIFVQRLTRQFGTKGCRAIDQNAIDAAGRVLCRPGATPATRLRNVITPARAVLSFGAFRGWCEPPKFQVPEPGQPRIDWLTPAEAEAMIAAAEKWTKHIRPLLVFLFCTGARLGEALSLQWDDVNLAHARAVLRKTKNGTDRQVDLCPRLVADMANIRHRTGTVFRAWKGEPYRATDDSKGAAYGGQIRKAWATCRKAAGISKQLTPHHARHSWASWHYAVHKDIILLQVEGGWAPRDLGTVRNYAHLTPRTMAPEITRFWGIGCAESVQTPATDAKISA